MATLLPISVHFPVRVRHYGWRYALPVAAWLLTTSALAQAPVITALSPTRNLRNAPASSNVAVTFDQPMSGAAASAASVRVFSQQRGGAMFGNTRGAASVSGNTITFDPANDFKPGETVSVTTTTAAQSSGGTNLAVGKVHQFITATGGTGAGNFQPHPINPTPTIGQGPFDLALADLDGDGDLDLVTANVSTADIALRFNDGAGNLTPPAANPWFRLKFYPASVVTADVDGDGDLDLLGSNVGNPSRDSGYVSLRLNNGSGVFTKPATGAEIHMSDITIGLAVGDVDGDGDLDFVTANYGNNNGTTASVRLNDGTGQFTAPATGAEVTVGLVPWKIALADVDADGDLDMLTASFSSNTVSLRLNDGTGFFTAPATGAEITVGLGPALLLNDIDGDNDLDLVTINYTDSTISRRFNNGAGVFSAPGANADMHVSGGAAGGTLADVDADGDLDLLVSSFKTAIVRVWRNDGSGNFTPPAAAAGPTTDGFNPVAMGDIDGDGDLDAVSANYTATTAHVWLNQAVAPTLTLLSPASGGVGAVVTISGTGLAGATGISFNGTAAASFTVNSATQITATVAAGTSTGNVTVTTPSGTSNGLLFTFTAPAAPVITALSPTRNRRHAPRAANVAITFDQAMSGAAASAASVKVFSQQRGGAMFGSNRGAANGSGNTITFDPANDFRPGETLHVTVTTDVRSSGGVNLATGHVYQFTAAAGVGPAVFGGGQNLTVSQHTAPALAVGDVDGDGDADLVTIDVGNGVGTWLNDGTGALAPHPTTPVSLLSVNAVGDMNLTDIDADGDLDLLIGQRNALLVLTNDGTGVFAQVQSVPLADDVNRVAVGDLDADGDLDAAVALRNGTLTVLRNGGSGTFAAAGTYTTGTRANDVAFGDIDADGDLDLVAAASGAGGSGLVLRNDGTGTFSNPTTLPGSRSGTTLADIDADGDLDLLISTGGPSGSVSVQRNDGTGSFAAAHQTLAVGNTPEALTTADFNGDGHLDLLIANTLGGTLSVRLNDGTGSFATTGPEINVGSQSRKPMAVDLDGDGDLDVLAAGLFNNRVITRFNGLIDLLVDNTQPIMGGTYHNILVTNGGDGTLTDDVTVVGTLQISADSRLNDGCFRISGPGNFVLNAGGALSICDPAGISLSGATGSVLVTGTRSFSSDAIYAYNGTAAQVTGSGLPATVRELIAQNPQGLSLSQPVGVRRVLRLAGGTLATSNQLTLLSDATRTAYAVHSGGLTSGAITVQRYVGGPAGLGYRHLSSPVQSTTVADLATSGFTPKVNPAYNAIPTPALPANQFPNVLGFDETRGGPVANFSLGYYSPTALTDHLTSGRGWSVYMPGARTPDFVGALTTGDVAMSGLTRTGAFLANAEKSGWHLLGNPYAQPIDWDLATVPAGMSSSISVYRTSGGNTGIYLTRANGLGSLPDGLVPLGQAFFARVTGAGPVDFTFTNALRVEANPATVARPTVETRPVVSLTLTDAHGQSDETFVYAEAGATPGSDDRFDGFKPGRNVGAPTLATLIGGEEAAINGLPETALTQPTTVELLAVLPAPGLYELRVNDLLNLDGVAVELLDRLAGTAYDLAINPLLHLRAARANEEIRGRFALVFNGQRVTGTADLAPLTTGLQLWPNPTPGAAEVTVRGLAAEQSGRLLDATGRVVRTSAADRLDVRGLAAGVYVLRTTDGRTARLVVE